MAYKKFIKRGEKIYGLYSYKSKKVNGKVTTEYLEKHKGKNPNHVVEKAVVFTFILMVFIFGVFLTHTFFSEEDFIGDSSGTSFGEFLRNLFFNGEDILLAPFENGVFVSPSSVAVNTGDSFIVDVAVVALTNTSDLYGIQFDVDYDSAILSFNSIVEGPLLSSDGEATFFNYSLASGKINNVYNIRNVTNGSLNPGIYSDAGIIARINFSAVGAGTSSIGFSEVLWVNSTITNQSAEIVSNITLLGGSVVVTGVDVTAPVMSNGQPLTNLSNGTTQTTISLNTNEVATCKYDTSSTTYALMANTFSSTKDRKSVV